MQAHEEATGTADVTFDLTSVIYHALEAADVCAVYLDDVQNEDDVEPEVVSLFEDVIAINRSLAERAKTILARRLAAETPAPIAERHAPSDE